MVQAAFDVAVARPVGAAREREVTENTMTRWRVPGRFGLLAGSRPRALTLAAFGSVAGPNVDPDG